jgi:hypothetical protein
MTAIGLRQSRFRKTAILPCRTHQHKRNCGFDQDGDFGECGNPRMEAELTFGWPDGHAPVTRDSRAEKVVHG